MKNLYIFLDESGNFDFSPKGTKHFVICSYSTTNATNLVNAVYGLRYLILCSGHEQEYFHATEDKQAIRSKFYDIISKTNGFYDFAYADKKSLDTQIQNKKHMYAILVKKNIKNVLERELVSLETYNEVIIISDKLLSASERNYLHKSVKFKIKKFKIGFKMYFFQTKSDCNAQIADYGSWAKYVSLERGEFRSIGCIQHLIKSDVKII